MDFNLDDPLGDLISDEGSDDSFFGTKNVKNSAAKPVEKVQGTKSKMENLFGIQEDTQPKNPTTTSGPSSLSFKKIDNPQVNFASDINKKPETPKPPAKKEITFDGDDDDIFADLGFDPKKPKGTGKKLNIMDDLLGLNEPKPSIQKTPTPKRQSTPNRPVTPTRPPAGRPQPLSRQSTFDRQEPIDEPISGGYAPSLARSKGPIPKRKSSFSAVNDPLGFFTGTTAEEPPKQEQKKEPIKKKSSTADWLGIGTAASIPVEPVPIVAAVPVPQQTQPNIPVVSNLTNIFKPNLSQSAQLMATNNLESEAALHNLQQQETQLMVASQMKNQEMALMDMQRKQQELLQYQEQNFNELLQKQMKRQGDLEESIRIQQERITSHIQVLMAQPMPPYRIEDKTKNAEEPIEGVVNVIELQNDVKRLELEKLRLEDLFQNIKGNHEQELEFLEQSHKKQIQLLEENLENLENRLRNENVSLTEFYTNKITNLTEEKATLIKQFEEKITKMEENYVAILAKLKTQHIEDVENIQEDHRKMITNLRESKLLEFALVQDNSSYLQTLKAASGFLENASEDLQTIRTDMEGKIERIHQERELQLVAREKRIEDQQKHFEKLRESTENERIKLLELIRDLETKLNSVNQTAEEEQWSMRQQRATLDAERSAFEREREFVREKILREEKRIEDLKAIQFEENQRFQKQIEDDRLTLLTEKSKLETLTRLQRPPEMNISKAEVDAAVKVAQDAARQSDLERERLLDAQRKLETIKRELIDQENAIRAKETDLQLAISNTKSKEANAEHKMEACKKVELKYFAKLKLLQSQYQDLNRRETKLSQSRLDLSRERLELQTLRKKLYQSRCSLCKIGERSQELTDLLTTQESKMNQLPNDMPNLEHEPLNYEQYNDDQIEDLLNREVAFEMNRINEANLIDQDDADDNYSRGGTFNLPLEEDSDILLARFNAMNKSFME